MTTPDLILDVGVIGPFEEGFLREEVSDRTFNLNVKGVKDMDALQGIINGDMNGLFQLDPKYNDGSSPLIPGTLVPEGPHGNVQEVIAPNVPSKDVLFPRIAMAKMDAECGVQQSLRAIRMAEGTATSDELARGWKNWKSFRNHRDQKMP